MLTVREIVISVVERARVRLSAVNKYIYTDERMNSNECARMREMLGDIFWHMETVLYHSDGDMQYHQLSLRAALTEAQEIIQMCPTSAPSEAALLLLSRRPL